MYVGGYGGFGGWHMMWDPTYVLVLAGVVLSLIASMMVKSTFSRYSTAPFKKTFAVKPRSASLNMRGSGMSVLFMYPDILRTITIQRQSRWHCQILCMEAILWQLLP